jgi:hypothetical protein
VAISGHDHHRDIDKRAADLFHEVFLGHDADKHRNTAVGGWSDPNQKNNEKNEEVLNSIHMTLPFYAAIEMQRICMVGALEYDVNRQELKEGRISSGTGTRQKSKKLPISEFGTLRSGVRCQEKGTHVR